MVGLIPGDVSFHKRPRGHGYTAMEVVEPNPFFSLGSTIRGHEFHHSSLDKLEYNVVRLTYLVRRGVGLGQQHDGILYKNTLASYNHVHASGAVDWAKNFVAIACQYREQSLPSDNLAVLVCS
jgi:cobyrinic acid a,c-diamide synthase